MNWKQGEHVALIGQTGCGKTTLARELLKLRGYVLCLITKPDMILWPGRWARVSRVKDIDLSENTRFILRPEYAHQQEEIGRGLLSAWGQGGWTLYIDELYYLEQQLRLEDQVVQLLTQGRSLNITVVLGMQRPAWVTRFALSEPTHIFCAKLGDQRDAQVIKSIIGSEYLEAVQTVGWHKFVYLNKISAEQTIVDKTSIVKLFTGGVSYGV